MRLQLFLLGVSEAEVLIQRLNDSVFCSLWFCQFTVDYNVAQFCFCPFDSHLMVPVPGSCSSSRPLNSSLKRLIQFTLSGGNLKFSVFNG